MTIVTVGLELEWADVDRTIMIPEHLGHWNDKDYSIVNSDGHANCPTGTTWRWGGEINTHPVASVSVLHSMVGVLVQLLRPVVNYKCNLHVHCRDERFDTMMQDVAALRRFFTYLRDSEKFVYSVVERIEPPDTDAAPSLAWLNGAMRRYRRNLDSHQHSLPAKRVVEILAATTPEELRDAHAPPMVTTRGRAWHITKRPGMNMRSLWKHGTVEYRHFPGTVDPDEAVSAARWCQLFTKEATNYALGLDARFAEVIYETDGPWQFPQFRPYDHELQLGFDKTRHKS